MKKISVILIGIVAVTIGILSIPKEEKKVLIEEELNNENTSLSFYIEQEDGNYEESSSLPSTGYVLDTERSICTNNTTPVWEDSRLYLDNLQNRGTSCYLYFKIYEPIAKEVILSHYDTVLTRSDFSTTVTDTTTGTIYKSLDESQYDNDGEVYYFAGNPTDNWVYFAGYYWRIIRINGDGTIRMIYNGTTTNQTGEDTQIGTSAYNSTYNDNTYVGYMYGMPGSSTYEETHANVTNSTIKELLDTWYQNNIVTNDYDKYISAEQGFCNDRRIATSDETFWNNDTKLGYGTNTTAYAPWARFFNTSGSFLSIQNPTLKCSQTDDYFTGSGSSRGNKALTYPIGLIATDEVVLAGGFGGSDNSSYYLYTGQDYWTMSPINFNDMNNIARVFNVNSTGQLSNYYVYGVYGVRPVINLKADVTITGSGTSTDPYRVEGA